MNKLPNKLARLRKHYNYSQAQVAEVLGIDAVDYMAFENGSAVCNFEQCKKLASFYRINVIELFSNSSSVGLHNVKGPSGKDEYYFLPDKTIREKVNKLRKVHPLRFGGIIVVLFILLCMGIYALTYKEYKAPELINANCLSMSDKDIYYIDGTGDLYQTTKTNGEKLIYTADQDLLMVVNGKDFVATLKKDGTVDCIGFSEEDTKK